MNVRLLSAIFFAAFAGYAVAATHCVSPGGGGGCSSSIQAAINLSSAGDTVLIKEGTYTENVVVNKSVSLVGESQEDTIVRPAVSHPICSPGSLCGGLASNIILVQANNVTIRRLTLDGDNPHLTSGVVSGGADLDARNGIITNHDIGVFNNLEVDHVTVKNVYLRGIYASSGGTFNFHDNQIRNVQADPASICMFNFGGSGVMAHNQASRCNDAISSNWSGGVQFLNNEVTDSGSGVHTDNAGGFGTTTPDLIQGNRISDGPASSYGIFVFVPYVPVKVDSNQISDVDVGLSAYGQGAVAGVATFSNNSVDLNKRKNSVGVFVTTNELGFGASKVSSTFTGNTVTKTSDGFILSNDQTSLPLTVNATCNSISNNSHSGVTLSGSATLTVPAITGNGAYSVAFHDNLFKNHGVGMNNATTSTVVDATHNWWGCSHGPGSPGCDMVSGSVAGNVIFTPFLTQPPACVNSDGGDDGEDNKDHSGN